MVSWTPPAPPGRGGMPGPRRRCRARPGRRLPARRRGAPPAGRGAPPAGAPPAGAAAAARPARPPAGAAARRRRRRQALRRAGRPQPARRPPRRGAPAPPPVENRLYFADYRDVDGMQFPFRLRRAVGADTIEETTFDRFKINAKIDPKKFEVRKPQ